MHGVPLVTEVPEAGVCNATGAVAVADGTRAHGGDIVTGVARARGYSAARVAVAGG